MAAYSLLCRIATSGSRLSSFLHVTRGYLTYQSTAINTRTLLTPPFQAISYANSASIFDPGNQTKYYIFGGKGGVGKTSCAASLAVKFAKHGNPTILVSLDPTHSLRDSFDQDLTKGAQIRGLKSSLYAIEINPEGYMKYFPGPAGLKDFMNTLGLGKLVEHFGESEIEKLLDSPDPGLNEAVEISRVMQIAESPDCSMYTRVVIDTSSKGDDLLHVFLSDWEIRDETTDVISSLIETDVLREPIENMKRARQLIRGSTEYVIVTTPTARGVIESLRLNASLKKEEGLLRRLIVSEIFPPSSTDCKFCSKRREDEMLTLDLIILVLYIHLDIIEVPLVDGEMIKGIRAFKSMGDLVWK